MTSIASKGIVYKLKPKIGWNNLSSAFLDNTLNYLLNF